MEWLKMLYKKHAKESMTVDSLACFHNSRILHFEVEIS